MSGKSCGEDERRLSDFSFSASRSFKCSTFAASFARLARKRKLFIIDTLQAKDIKVRVSSSSLGKNSIHFKLPKVVIDNFADTDETPLTGDEIIYRLVYSIIDRLVAQSPENYQKLIRKLLLEQLDTFYKK